VNEALANLQSYILPDLGQETISNVLSAVPGVIGVIDAARSDPDDCYITAGTVGDRDQAIWPAPGSSTPMRAGQSEAPNITLSFEGTQNISLWDYDSVSRDDLLGSITASADEIGQEMMKPAVSQVEGSVYYVQYAVY
jgi:hypothetical protein